MDSRAFKNKIRHSIGFHLIIPVIFLTLLVFMLSQIPIINCIFPASIDSSDDVFSIYKENTYVECTADTLYYTGYDYMLGNNVRGHYYYSLVDGRCTIYVLSCKYILSLGGFSEVLNNVTFRAELVDNDHNLKDLLSLMAGDMNWSYDGINSCASPIIVNELAYSPVSVSILSGFLTFVFIFTLSQIVSLIHGLIRPFKTRIFSHTLRENAPAHITCACGEIADCEPVINDFYLTASYFINTTPHNMAIIPYSDIKQVYHYNTLHGLPMRRHLAASLIILTGKGSRFRFRHLPPETAALIADMLPQKNPDITSGLPTAKSRPNDEDDR